MNRRWYAAAWLAGGIAGCNFSTDGPWDYECTPEEIQGCEVEDPPAWFGQGVCAAPQQTCDASGFWAECVVPPPPGMERCETDEDDNCDGVGPCDGGQTGSAGFVGEGEQQFAKIAVLEVDGKVSLIVAGLTNGPFELGGKMIPHTEGEVNDAFVARLDGETMMAAWIVPITGDGNQLVHEIAVTPAGDVLVVGQTGAGLRIPGLPMDYGSDKAGGFALKLSGADGTLVWDEPVWTEGAFLMEVVASGEDAMVGGYFDSDGPFGCDSQHSGGMGDDALVARLDGATGACEWSLKFGGSEGQTVRGLAVGADGAIYVSGNYGGALGLANKTTVESQQFLARFDAAGGLEWVHTLTTLPMACKEDPCESDLAVRADGGVVMLATYTGVLDEECERPEWESDDGDDDTALLQYRVDGSLAACRVLGGVGEESGFHVAVDANGDAIAVGKFDDEFIPGTGAPLKSPGGDGDVFIHKVRASGEQVWPTRWTRQNGRQLARGAATDGRGNIYVVGDYAEDLKLEGSGGQWGLAADDQDGFILKLRP